MKTKNIKNKITKIIIISLLLFINIKNVSASGKAYNTKEVLSTTTDLIENSSVTDKPNFVVCAYSCASDNIGTEGGNCGDEGSKFSAIYYYYEDAHKWGIKTNVYLSPIRIYRKEFYITNPYGIEKDKSADPVITQYIFDNISYAVPSGGIYYENPTGTNKDENWAKTEQYNNLKTSFECPKYMYYDHTIELSYDHITNLDGFVFQSSEYLQSEAKKIQDKADNAMELCYANSTKKCMDRDEDDKTSFGKENNLNYSLTEEINTMFNGTNIELTNMNANTILERGFGTQDDICTALKNKKYDELANTSTYEVMLDEIFKTKMRPDSPNMDVMGVKNIEKLLLPEKGYNTEIDVKYDSNSLTDKYKNLKEVYLNKLKESVDYYSNQCGVDRSTISDEQLTTMFNEKVNKIVESRQNLDYGELDCDTLFADMADIIKDAYFILEIISILIVVIRTALDYSKVFLSDDKDQLKKANDKLIKRIVILIIILLLPALVNLFLRIFKIEGFNSENPLCIKIK